MMLPRHNYRSPEMRAAEERLVYETLGNAETQQKAHIETVLQSSAPTQDQLDQLARLIQTEHPQVAIQGAKETFRKLEGKAKSQVTENISKLEARSRVIAASDEEQSALQASIDALKGEDVLTISPQSESPTVETDTPHTFVDKAKDVAKTVGKSLGDAGEQMTNAVLPASITKEMSRNKKIAIAGVATVGVGLVLWSLFKRARRAAGEGADAAQQTEGGFFRKWLVRIGVTAGVLFGVKMLADRYLPSGTTKDILDGAGAIGGGAFIGGKKGMETVAENFRRSFEFKNRTDFQTDTEYHQYLASIVEDHGDEVIDRKNFASNEEYTKAMEGMLDVYQQNGGNWVLTGNTLMFIGRNGYDTVNHVGKLDDIGINLWGAITEKSFEKGQDAAMLYGEGVVLYASSFALLDGAYLSLVLGPKGAAIQAVKNSLGWPFSIYGKGKSIVGIFIPSEAKAIRSIEKAAANASWGYNLKRIKEWGKGIKEWNSGLTMTEEYAESLFEEYQQWRKFDKQFESYKQYKSALGHRQAVLQKKLEEVCKNLIREQKIIPNFLKNPNAADLVEQIKRGQVTIGNFEATMDKLYTNFETTSANAASSSVNTATNTADEIAETGTDASKAAKATTPEAASQTHHTGQKSASKIDNVDNLKSVEKVADTLSDADLDTFLKTNNIPDALRAEVLADPNAKNIIKGALATGDAAEEARVIQMLQKGSKMRTAVVGGGLALSTLGLYMAYVELSENKEKMLNTKNQELQKLYAESNIIIGVDMGVQVTGILVDGVALYQAASGTVLCSAAAPAGVILLPITVAVMVGREGWRQSAQLREYFAKTDEDLEKDAPSTIFAHIEESKPLTSINTMQSFIETLSVQDAKDQQKANLNARQNGYRAYFAQSAIHLIPHPTEADVRASRSMNNASVSDHDVEMLYKDWISQYVLEAESCIRERTKNQFYLIDADNLSQVRIEAFARWRTKRWGVEGQTPLTPRSTEAMWEEDIATMAVEPDLFIQEFPNYLLTKTRVADALAFAERYLSADTLLSAAKKQIARANLFYDVRQAIRDVTAHVDTQKSISGSAIQHLISDIVHMTEGYALKTKEKTPMTTMMKELIDQPFILNAQTFTHLFTKYPLRPTY